MVTIKRRTRLTIGDSTEIRYIVQAQDLAAHLVPSLQHPFPEVYTSGRMISLMELAAAKLMAPIVGSAEMSVGYGFDILHTAPTPVAAEVVATATYLGLRQRFHLFEVTARDSQGEIGSGYHQRAIVNGHRFHLALAQRVARPRASAPALQ